jgi:hypothetical protein
LLYPAASRNKLADQRAENFAVMTVNSSKNIEDAVLRQALCAYIW